MNILNKEFPELPGFEPTLQTEKWDDFSISMEYSEKKIFDLKTNFNIDGDLLLKNTLINNVYESLGQYISKLVFNSSDISDISLSDLSSLRIHHLSNGILTSLGVLAKLKETEYYSFENKRNLILNINQIYLDGYLKFIESEETFMIPLYVNPYINFNDNRLGIMPYKFWNFEVDENFDIVENEIMKILKIKYKVCNKNFLPIVYKIDKNE